jgi:hypothetical protein
MNKKYIQELLHFLFDEREKIEATGHSRMMDPDLIKTHEFICDQIQGLHRKIFEDECQQFSERLAEVYGVNTKQLDSINQSTYNHKECSER